MLTDLAIWYLRKRNRSVVIGMFVANGLMVSRNNNAFWYDNTMHDVDIRNVDGSIANLPNGKFKTKKQFEE